MKKTILFIIVHLLVINIFAQAFSIGDKVEIYNSGAWYKGNIQETGTGNYTGYYYIHYDNYNNGQWIKASDIRSLQNSTASAVSPRHGMYNILSYGSPSNPIRIGYFELSSGKYTYYNMDKKTIGSGTYSYDVAGKTIRWLTGPFKDANWNGGFEIDREGKTHKIRLNRVTIGSNSVD